MNSLMKKLSGYGVDIVSVMERFVDDEQLYEKCLFMFLEDKAFPSLSAAIVAGNYQTAFECAHTLKGVAGNLGLTPLFDVICLLVESLRSGKYEAVARQHEQVRIAHDELCRQIR